MSILHASTKSTLHRKSKGGLVRCDGRYYRIHNMNGFPYTGEVTLQFNGSNLSVHEKNDISKSLYVSDAQKMSR